MIFVTVGTDTHDFSRLVKKADEMAGSSDEKFIIQRGHTNYEPENCEHFDFLPKGEFERYVERADIVITHAGVGSIMTCLKHKKKPVAVPRREKYGEHINDHQLDIAKTLGKKGKVIPVYDIKKLGEKIRKGGKIKSSKGKGNIVKAINKFMESVKG